MFDKRITLEEKNPGKRHLQNYYKPSGPRWAFWLTVLFLVALSAGCFRLPDYARPQFYVPENGAAISRDSFTYRTLTIEDFRARDLPSAYSRHHHRINAHSCISIRPAKGMQAQISTGAYDGHLFFMGRLLQVRFEAVFVPGCSWWRPDIPEEQQAYVLQHEQIHFALAELAARRLTREARKELADYLAVGDSQEAVKEELSDKIQAMARDAMEASFEEHMDFDEETSLTYDPDAQRRWMEEVARRLAQTTAP
jgi:hypothetical protein